MPVDLTDATREFSSIRMGDIFMVDWNSGRGSEQAGERPALIVQNNPFNANDNYPNTIVVTIGKTGHDVPTHVKVPQNAENGLWESLSYIKCEQLFAISKSRVVRRLGKITPEQLADVSRALKRLLSLA